MIKLKFEYDRESNWLYIKPFEKKHKSLELLSGKNWYSEDLKEDIKWTNQCKAGIFSDEDGNDGFDIGFEYSPGIITVFNDIGAFVTGQYNDKEYLTLSFDEVLDILHQMSIFLQSIGK
ncbi:hypothetical protein [Chryseobacterium caseinilyticum]|uniref:SMI1/KNR4 family protein n=1 Tax=Chryseobacterium caseinilyticum TaxID=2771428 RepID=A0ABR8ZHA4_9FLAO|nr:hypothetical protein [Chryseobacterium caseinilyticum]MBD8084235.1 hypothetical protein [Chryseobacterium caseinilyticum]